MSKRSLSDFLGVRAESVTKRAKTDSCGNANDVMKQMDAPLPTEPAEVVRTNTSDDGEPAPECMVDASDAHASRRYLATVHAHPKDDDIVFVDKGHHYYVRWNKDDSELSREYVKSVTKFTGDYFEGFDADKIIAGMRANWKSRHEAKYGGMTDDQIKASWERNRDKAGASGTSMHESIEMYYNGELLEHEHPESDEWKMFHQYHAEEVVGKLDPYRTEQFVWSDDKTRVTGAIDMEYVKSVDDERSVLHLRITDWKRSKEIKMFSHQKGRGPCSNLRNTNYSKYCMQLNTYKYIIENYYSGTGVWKFKGKTYDRVVVDDMWLCVCHPDQKHRIDHANRRFRETFGKRVNHNAEHEETMWQEFFQEVPAYYHLEIPDLQDVVEQMFEERRVELAQARGEAEAAAEIPLSDDMLAAGRKWLAEHRENGAKWVGGSNPHIDDVKRLSESIARDTCMKPREARAFVRNLRWEDFPPEEKEKFENRRTKQADASSQAMARLMAKFGKK